MVARTAFYAPAHRVMGRVATGSGSAAQPPWIAPSFDAVGNGYQDARWPWNTGANASVPNVMGWYDPGCHPVLDFVPATLTTTAIAAAQVPVAATPLTLVSSSGAGIIISSAAQVLYPANVTIPAASLFIENQPVYRNFGLTSGSNEYANAMCYDAATMVGRSVAIHSVGDDSAATAVVAGYDIYGYAQTETLTLTNASTVTGKKAFKVITSITPAGTLSGANVSAGQSDVYGLPMLATAASAIWGFWANAILAGAGTFVAADTTSPATGTTGDVRGTYVPASASNASRRLTLWQHPSLSQMITSGINIGMFGVTPA